MRCHPVELAEGRSGSLKSPGYRVWGGASGDSGSDGFGFSRKNRLYGNDAVSLADHGSAQVPIAVNKIMPGRAAPLLPSVLVI
jgi:hypothetical protein